MSNQKSICIIGAGNVGLHLARALKAKRYPLLQIYSRNPKNAQAAGRALATSFTHSLKEITPEARFYFLAVPDDAIEKVAKQISPILPPHSAMLHTSGSSPMSILLPYFERIGVFYPLQTFTKGKSPDFSQIPICLEANSADLYHQLDGLAKSLSKKVLRLSDKQRKTLHVAAVFVNNFGNKLLEWAHQMCEEDQIPFDILRPLAEETVRKAFDHTPASVQTGPAIRGDKGTLEEHIAWLKKNHPDLVPFYQWISKDINAKLKS